MFKIKNAVLTLFLIVAMLLPSARVFGQEQPPADPPAPTLGHANGPKYRIVERDGTTYVVPEADVDFSRAEAAPVVETDIPLRLRVISDTLGIPINALQAMPSEDVFGIIEENAQKLGLDVHRKQADGTYLQTGWKGGPPPPKPEGMKTLDMIYASYRPTVVQPKPAPRPVARSINNSADIIDVISWAGSYMRSLTQFPADRGFTKEYSGFPLWIDTVNGPAPTIRLIGHYNSNRFDPFVDITAIAIGSYYELQDTYWDDDADGVNNDMYLWADRWYYPYSTDTNATVISYNISVRSWAGGNTGEDLYLFNTLLVSDIGTKGLPYNVSSLRSRANAYHGGIDAMRYTYFHATQLARYVYFVTGLYTQSGYLWNSLNDRSFWNDLYAPLFGDNTALDSSWFFTNDVYKVCDNPSQGANYAPYPWGVHENVTTRWMQYYPYESKVCTLGRSNYIALSRLDNLVPAIQAIHALNKWGNPDFYYLGPDGANYTTPRQMARYLEANAWNGYGINIYGKNPIYASGVRTNAFLVLETLLGYKYGDTTSRNYADSTAAVLIETQWGTDYTRQYYGDTDENGQVLRPQFSGGQIVGWKLGNSFPYSLPPRTFLNDVLDLFNMPDEVLGIVPVNAESTGTFFQAMRVYLKYRYNMVWGSGLIP